MKRVHQSGNFRIDLNKYTTDDLTLRFDENIGDLRSLHGDNNYFRQVNLDDPLFQQREIVAFVDGVNTQDFGQFVNFVSVRMRKRHAAGDETTDEVRIDRVNFNRQGNNFKLMYGWLNDNNRRNWLQYDYTTTWSFFGGKTVEVPWQTTTAGAINLAPPYQRRFVDLQADPTTIASSGVRAITVKIYYNLGGTELTKQTTLNIGKSQLSDRIEFMLPGDSLKYDYEVTWLLTGNRTLNSGRKSSTDTLLFVDSLPTT